MVYYKCTEKCSSDLSQIVTVNLLDTIFNRSLSEKINNMCHYFCLKDLNLKNIKRNGRWGFCPILGMTEFFSSLFSFTNFLINIISYNSFIKPNLRHLKLRSVFILQYLITNMAFLSSTLFHIHENTLTRNMDYFFAILVLLFGLYMSIMRLALVYNLELRTRKILRSIFISYYIFHVSKMAQDFDYVFNKFSCLIIIILTLSFNFFIYKNYKNFKYAKNILFFTGLFFLAGYIEIQDLPPYSYLIDSHAMWHLFGSLCTPFYMKFWGDDIKNNRLLYNNIRINRKMK
ncbi:Per1-like protein [Vairimorpha necatrix]|uniref:Post-GPI attachment to proteins factor 3 n=1 Tax=Vairimorpha necatrix TaxID=6039 RepID=A0AAX4JEF1_9MICR